MNLLTDHDHVVRTAAERLSVPRRSPASSFVLHAPLELMARVGLLAYIPPADHGDAVATIADLVERYEAADDPMDETAPESFAGSHAAALELDGRLRAGDVDGIDAVVRWLGENCDTDELRRLLGGSIIDSLAAAGHAPIGLHLLATVADASLPGTLLRGPLREIARHPEWRLCWFRDVAVDAPPEARATLADALSAVPHLGRPGSDFIYPIMSQIESSGLATQLLKPVLEGGIDLASARSTITRAAAWSMIEDDPSQAPYGWTHALTMPQGVLSLPGEDLDPRTAIAVAATFIAGFRAAHGTEVLGSLADDAPIVAEVRSERTIAEMALHAVRHEDAHLVKYTLACFHAAVADPAWSGVYLAAAQYLAEWWEANDR